MALKKVTELDKSEKLMLLKSIALGDVDRKTLTPETFVAIRYKDAFLGLMVSVNNEGTKTICLGEASAAMERMTEISEDNFL